MKNKNLTYPFTAIVVQGTMKKALILNAVNPKFGGVLIRGEKGTAKSTNDPAGFQYAWKEAFFCKPFALCLYIYIDFDVAVSFA